MATIRPFTAIRPSPASLRDLAVHPGGLQHKLELESAAEGDTAVFAGCKKYLQQLIASGQYVVEESAALYVYETTMGTVSQTGIWVLTDLSDNERGKIITHEETLAEREVQIRNYRKQVGLEGTPVLLTYRGDIELSDLIEMVKTTHVPQCFYVEEQYHRIWRISLPGLISQFQDCFRRIDQVYLADGHHRLAAAASLHQDNRQWISSLYVPSSELIMKPFHRMVIPSEAVNTAVLLENINAHYYSSLIPNNKAYRPDKMNRVGFYAGGLWYQLDLRRQVLTVPDVLTLQEMILEPFFGIADPRTDSRLFSFPAEEGWNELLVKLAEHPDAIAFTLFPMSARQMMQQADSKVVLPPKSTWIAPKVPFGLLMYCTLQDLPDTLAVPAEGLKIDK